MGLIYDSFDGSELEGRTISLREGMVGKLKILFCNLYSPTWGEVYEIMALPLDSPLEGTSLQTTTLEEVKTLSFTMWEYVTTLEVEGGTKGTRCVEDKKSSQEGIKLQYWNGLGSALTHVNLPSLINFLHWCNV